MTGVSTWLHMLAVESLEQACNKCPVVLSPDLTQQVYCFQYNALAIWKAIYTGVGFGSEAETRCAVVSFSDPLPSHCCLQYIYVLGTRLPCMDEMWIHSHIPCLCIRNSLIAMATWDRSRRLCCMTGLRKSRYLSLRRSSSVAWGTRQSEHKYQLQNSSETTYKPNCLQSL